MKISAAVLLAAALSASLVGAQPARDVSVTVLDAEKSTPLADAVVSTADATCTTDGQGRCTLSLAAATARLAVTAPGYADQAVDLDLADGQPRAIDVRLIARDRFQEQVDVVAPDTPVTEAPAQIPVRPDDVMEVAGGAENVFHVLQTLPGVASPEEFSGRLSVRGGGPDENLTVMDGVEIHNPYRLFGLVSAFNPETIQSFDLSAGAFDARYGDRLSSLLLIRSRSGRDDSALSGTAALSVTDTNVVGEGRMPIGTGSWLFAARRTYYDLVAERFTDQDLPSFTDLQAKAQWDLGRGRNLSFFTLRSRESSDASFDDPKAGAEGAFTSRTRNQVFAATFSTPLGPRLSSRTIFSAYENTEAADFGGDFRNKGRRSNAPGDEAYGTSRVEVTWESRVRDHAIRQELTWPVSPQLVLEAGGEVHGLDTRIRFLIPADRNTQEANGSSLAGGAGLPEDLDSTRTHTRTGAWLQSRLHVTPRWLLEPGLRVDHSGANARTSLSPRLSSTYTLGKNMRLRAAAGIYTQSVGYEKLVQADYFMDLSGTGPLDLENERSRHALLGIERDLAPGLSARLELYYKTFDRLVVGRLETPQETAERIGGYDFPSELQSEIPRDPWITTQPVNGGKGHAYGFDVYVARKAAPDARLSGWASYTYGQARREAYGLDYPFDYDRRHAVSLVGNLQLSRKLDFSATVRVSSGFPRTPVLRLRVADTPDALDRDGDGNREELVPDVDGAGRLVYVTDLGGIDNLNTARLPMYARVDARLTYSPTGRNGRVKLYLDVINVLNRDNAGVLEPILQYDPGSDRPRLTEEASASIPLLPSIGIHVDMSRRRGSGSATIRHTAAPAPPRAPRPAGGWAVSARPLSTVGPGFEVTRALMSRLNARLGAGIPLNASVDETASNTDYAMKYALGGGQATLDWFPLGGFHASAGVLVTRGGFDIESAPATSLEVGGRTYSSQELTALTGRATTRRFAPYFGLGWGNPVGKGKQYGVTIDVGIASQGRPAVTLDAIGPAADAEPVETAARLAIEERDLSERLKGWAIYPVVSISVSRRF